jgi:3-hydroxyacyl-CoA dehydrogenase
MERMPDLVLTSRDGDVMVVTINNPPVNALSPGVPEGILAAVQSAASDAGVKSVVIIGGGRTFIAGADIKEFGKITSGGRGGIALTPLLAALEDSPKPIIMAIHGTALGGGLETAMAGHYRVAAPSAQVGQPEVKLGIIPGAAGTQRLPRLAGIEKAMEMCAFGEPISAQDALAAGIVDQILEGDLLSEAIRFARSVPGVRKTRERGEKLADAASAQALASKLKAAAAKRMRGQRAPLAAIDAVAAAAMPFAEGCDFERRLFEECLFGTQSKAMIYAFFGERAVAKIPGLAKDTPVLSVSRAAIVGAGTMGGGIAMVYANAGIPVVLKEISQEALDRGMARIAGNYAASVKKGRITQAWADQRLALIEPTLRYDGFEQADIVIEAVFENMELKKKTFAELDQVSRAGAILASNTSTLDIDELARTTKRPDWVVGHHYFSPANVMRLLEIVRGAATSDSVVATSMELARKLKKVGVLAGNCRGFIGNRMFGPYRNQAIMLVEEGALPQQVDQALFDWGMAMGPFAVGDLAGLDVGWRIRKEFKHLELPGVRYAEAEDVLCEAGHFGQKTGAGWYRYDENRSAEPDPWALEQARAVAAARKIPQRTFSAEEIVERTVYALVNEGARILEDGIALRPVDIDIIYLTGYGFPAWRGGPMFYAESVGLGEVYSKIKRFHDELGPLWEPAPLLEQAAREGKSHWQDVQ